MKTIGMPIITEEIVTTFKPGGDNQTENMDMADFGFLYGTFPTAPSVFVYATKYDLESDIIAAAMVACTFVSAPIMFISAKLLSLKNINPEDYLKVLGMIISNNTHTINIYWAKIWKKCNLWKL